MSDRNKITDELHATLPQDGSTDPQIELPLPRIRPRGVVRTCMEWAIGDHEDEQSARRVLVRQLLRRVALFALVAFACIWGSCASDDPKDLLYSTRHGAMAVLAVVSAGWVFLLGPTAALALAWILAYVHDHPGLFPKHADYDPIPFVRSALTIGNRLVMQLCAALTCVFVIITLADDLLTCTLLVGAYLIVVPKGIQLLLLRFVRRPLERWAHAPIGIGELVYLQHVFFPLVTCVGFLVLYSLSAETLGLRELAWCVTVLVFAHWMFAGLWFAFSLRQREAMDPGEREKRAGFRRRVAERSRWEGPTILVGLGVFAALPFLGSAHSSRVAEGALLDRRQAEGPTHACPNIDELSDAEVAIFLVSDNQFRALDGSTIAHSPQIAALVDVAVRPVELDLLSVAALDHFARMYRELLERKRVMGWDQLDVRWAHLGDFGDLACRSELRRLEGRIPCFGEESLAGIVPGNHDSYFTGNFGWHPDWSVDRACPGAGGPMSRTEAPSVADIFEDAVGSSPSVLDQSGSDETSFFASIADLGEVGSRPVLGVFFDTSDFAGSSAGAAGVQGEITSDQEDWILDALGRIGGDPLVVFFMHHPIDDLSTLGRWRVNSIAESMGDRLIAIVSGHTHQSQQRSAEIGDREVPEFVVGSTTDPPQEAALFTLRASGDELAIGFQTVPSVARATSDSGAETVILARECEAVIKQLRGTCECKPLFDPKGERDATKCATTPLDTSVHTDPLQIQKRDMANRARALFDCTERVAGTDAPRWPERIKNPPTQDGDPYRAFQDDCSIGEIVPEERHKELVCLSWVASTLQGRDKSEGWTFAEASEIAFERLAANHAWRTEVKVTIPGLAMDDAHGSIGAYRSLHSSNAE